jgi:hypothetical protein
MGLACAPLRPFVVLTLNHIDSIADHQDIHGVNVSGRLQSNSGAETSGGFDEHTRSEAFIDHDVQFHLQNWTLHRVNMTFGQAYMTGMNADNRQINAEQ